MPVDFSPLYAPVPESPSSRGLRGIGDAMDAIVARRAAQEQARLQREQAHAHALMTDDRQRDATKVQADNVLENQKLRKDIAGASLEERRTGRRQRVRMTKAQALIAIPKLADMGDLEGADRLRAYAMEPDDDGDDDQIEDSDGEVVEDRQGSGNPRPGPMMGEDEIADLPLTRGPVQARGPIQTQPPAPNRSLPADLKLPPHTLPPGGAVDPGQVAPPPAAPPPLDVPGAIAAPRAAAPQAAPQAAPPPPVAPLPAASPAQAVAPRPETASPYANRAPAYRADRWHETQVANKDHPPEVVARLAALRESIAQDPNPSAAIRAANDEIAKIYSDLRSAANARLATERRETPSGGEQARLDESNLVHMDANIKEWKSESGYNEARETLRAMDRSEAAIKSGNPISETGARYAIGRAIAGTGVFTEGEQASILGNIGGKFEGWEQLLQTWKDGRLTPSQRKFFESYVYQKRDHIRRREAQIAAESFRESYLSPDSGFARHRKVAINRYNRLFTPFGLPALDEEGNERKQAAPTGPGAAPAPGGAGAPGPKKPVSDAARKLADEILGGPK